MTLKSVHKKIIFSLLYLIIGGICAFVPALLNLGDFYRIVRPLDDIPRELWLYLYNRVFVITAMLICLISLLFYLLEEFRYVLASWFRFWLHVILLLITIITGILIVKFFYPFASDMNLKIFGSMTAVFLVQSILYLWPLAPTNYKGLFR